MGSTSIEEMEGDGVDVGVPWQESKLKRNFFLVRLFLDIFQAKKNKETNKYKIDHCYAYTQGSKTTMLLLTIKPLKKIFKK